jgi:uncharacterized protein
VRLAQAADSPRPIAEVSARFRKTVRVRAGRSPEAPVRRCGVLLPSCGGSGTAGQAGRAALLGRLLKGRVGLRWYLAVLLLPLLVPLGVGLSVLFGGESLVIASTIVGVVVGFAFSIFPGGALGEELGWRGLALPCLQAHHSALHASLVVGALWGFWHLPLYLERRPLSLFPAFVLSVVAASVVCTWMYNGTGGSLLIVMLYHATANFPLTVFLEPLGGRAAQPFLIYVALSVVTAAAIVVATGPEHLSRTHGKQVTTP